MELFASLVIGSGVIHLAQMTVLTRPTPRSGNRSGVREGEEQMEKQTREQSAQRLPEIIVGDSDYARLTSLANAALETLPETAEELLSELDRARIVADESVPGDVVRMGSVVEFRTGAERKRVSLVFPPEADIAAGKVSVLTPVGAA